MPADSPETTPCGERLPRASRRSLSSERARELSRLSWEGLTPEQRSQRTLHGRARAGAAARRALDELSQHEHEQQDDAAGGAT